MPTRKTTKPTKAPTRPSEATGEASFRPETLDDEARTVDVVFTTGAEVLRGDLFSGEKWYERLKVDDEAIDLTRLNSGAPLLDSHDQLGGVRNVLGVVERAWVDGNEGVATVRFSERAADVQADVRDGIVRKISVGYSRNRTSELDEDIDGVPVREVTRWTPHELSFVTVPADNGAQVRGAIDMDDNGIGTDKGTATDVAPDTRADVTATSNTADLTNLTVDGTAGWSAGTINIGDTVSDAIRGTLDGLTLSGAGAVDDEETRETERERVTEILDACERTGLGNEFARNLIDEGVALIDARAKIIEAIADKDANEVDHRIEPGDGAREKEYAQLASTALAHRSGFERSDDEAVIRQSYQSFADVARACAVMDGLGTSGMDPHTLATRAVTSTTLADTVALTAGRSLVKGYESETRTFTAIFRESTAQNFRDIMRVKLSDAPALALVAEGADYTEGTLSDEKETYTLSTYGKLLAITRQMIVNDDLDALTRLPQQMGAAAARIESDVVWTNTIEANGNMADGTPIFAAGRSNLVTLTALSAAAIEAARAHFRAVTAPQGAVLNVAPRYLVVGEGLETTAEKLLAPPSAYSTATAGDVLSDRLRGQLTLIVEPRITADRWYLFADYNQIDTAEYSFLGSRRGAYVESEVAFVNKNLQLTVTDDFGAGVVDWRGMYRGDA